MRQIFVSNNHIGKTIALPIYTNKGFIFVREGNVLTEALIEKLHGIGIAYIYVEENFADNVVIELALPDTLRLTVLQELQALYKDIEKNRRVNEAAFTKIARNILMHINVSENSILPQDHATNDFISKLAMHSLHVAVSCIYGLKNRREKIDLIEKVIITALLHDVGKLIDKNDPLQAGVEVIKSTTNYPATIYIPIMHLNERYDGTGPLKVKGDSLFLNSQVLHIANDYVNLLSKYNRVYEAVETLSADAVGKFDMDIFKSVTDAFYCYPNGLMVQLLDKREGIVVRQNKNFTTRPVVMTTTNEVVDLVTSPTIFIASTLD
ncbi:MAG: hypothetical protein ATN35_04905 [Epulopiscium sp. Nele67-Bin004]|nr:MAG: hypothetical protein ATN35_04905 [Epulopiscium sp. Nele67-Bin004]